MIELWGGLECTVNRVAERYFDQVVRTGHHNRASDLDLIADLGIRSLRYPVLWERTTPNGEPDWKWTDDRLQRLRALDIDPIVGLVHHGSGPRHTSLMDPLFADKLADYAGAVAQRYPWVSRFTPVNEPLTTARFSALYGHWYPHARGDREFVRALLNQCRGIALAMREIRRVNSQAVFVQTEDLGRTFSTAHLSYQAEFENERRWLSCDLLCGRVDRQHGMWRYLLCAGAVEEEILWFRDHPCPPDILGINYYVTSDRYLDERLDLYPVVVHGRNAFDVYADVEAVRVDADLPFGSEHRLMEAWERYRLPLAITEVHLGSDLPGERLSWFREGWAGAERLQHKGVDVRAVTAWALFGSYDWHCLVTRQDDSYECGVFDIRHESPQPTLLSSALHEIGHGRVPAGFYDLQHAGWWHNAERVQYEVSTPQRQRLVRSSLESCWLDSQFTSA